MVMCKTVSKKKKKSLKNYFRLSKIPIYLILRYATITISKTLTITLCFVYRAVAAEKSLSYWLNKTFLSYSFKKFISALK